MTRQTPSLRFRAVPYSGRTPHLHVRIRPASGSPLTTQVYIAGDNSEGDFVLAGMPAEARERLTMALAPAAGSGQRVWSPRGELRLRYPLVEPVPP